MTVSHEMSGLVVELTRIVTVLKILLLFGILLALSALYFRFKPVDMGEDEPFME